MGKRFESIALMGNAADARVVEAMVMLATHLTRRKVAVLAASDLTVDDLPAAVERVPADQLAPRADLLVAIGGDGAMLKAARIASVAGTPLLGINRGRLGFLADVSPEESLAPIDEVLDGHHERDRRMLLNAEIQSADRSSDCGLALNDVVVKRQDTGRLLEFRSYVDGRYVNTHSGDGFIVATPTGSTAYALSCGGPIVAPSLDAIVLAPICPHTLSDRPLMIPATSVTEIRLGDDHADTAEVSCDGEVTGQIVAGDRLRIAAANIRVELIHPTGYDYFGILRSKLNWGRSNRGTGNGT